jgi:hypothetical protein
MRVLKLNYDTYLILFKQVLLYLRVLFTFIVALCEKTNNYKHMYIFFTLQKIILIFTLQKIILIFTLQKIILIFTPIKTIHLIAFLVSYTI